MRKILQHEGCHVFDDLLESDEFIDFFKVMQTQVKYRALSSHEYIAVWEPTDGQMLRGQQLLIDLDNLPGNQIGSICKRIVEAIQTTNIQNAKTLSLIPYCWSPGTSIKWHTDRHVLGAITFYLHRYWNSEWGGEFLHLNEDSVERDNEAVHYFVDNQEISSTVVDNGIGVWVAPKPNRLIVNESGEWHKVVKTAPRSGYRFSIQGFIMDSTIEDNMRKAEGSGVEK